MAKKEKKTQKKDKKAASAPAGDMLTANLLAMLNGWHACGYDLINRLSEAGLGEYNSGTIYRALRQMEKSGLVSSMWDTSEDGPAKRLYSVTQGGSLFLKNWLGLLETHQRALEMWMDFGKAAAGMSTARTETTEEDLDEDDSDDEGTDDE